MGPRSQCPILACLPIPSWEEMSTWTTCFLAGAPRPPGCPTQRGFSWFLTSASLPVLVPPGVQARDKPPDDAAAPARRRTTSEGQYESGAWDASPARSPTARSPVHCVSPEVVSTIAANPGGRPREVLWAPLPNSRSCGPGGLGLGGEGALLGQGLGLTVSPALLRSLTSTATRKPSKRWRGRPQAAHPPAAVRFPPQPLPSPSRHKPYTLT